MARVRVPRFLAASIAVLALACTSPTLPLPPPASPTIAVTSEPNMFRLSSGPNGAEPNALIVVVNRNEQVARNKRVSGTIADEQGAWDVIVFANVGDALDVSQESGSTRSPAVTVTVR